MNGRLVPRIDLREVDVVHERVDVGTCRRAEVHVIRMLVHVERQERHAACERVRVVGAPIG